MKRIMAFIFPIMLMFLLCTPVYAAGTVSTVNAEAEEDTIHVWGTTENVTAAVAIQVLDETDNIVVMDSLTVLGDVFDGEISGLTLTEGKTYSVRVADYDGGVWQVAMATVPISVTSVTVTPSSGTLTTVGETLQLTAGVLPENASNRNVSWVSSNTSVATVDQTGKVTAVANGTAVITVTTQDGNKTAIANITVSIPISVTSVTVTPSSGTLTTVGETLQLTAGVLPENASNRNVSWVSSNTNVATVDQTGKVTAVANGTAVITATTQDGNKTATANITVRVPISVTSVTVTPSSGTLTTVGETLQLTAGVLPENASNRNVSWVSSNTNVATVDQTGKVTAVANGTAVITVTTQDGSITATANITVNIVSNNTGGGENFGNSGNTGSGENSGNNGNTANSGNTGSGNVAESISTKNDANEAKGQNISPKTGDESNLLVWSLMLIGISAILVGIGLLKRRKRTITRKDL